MSLKRDYRVSEDNTHCRDWGEVSIQFDRFRFFNIALWKLTTNLRNRLHLGKAAKQPKRLIDQKIGLFITVILIEMVVHIVYNTISVTRLSDLLDFGQLFKAFGHN